MKPLIKAGTYYWLARFTLGRLLTCFRRHNVWPKQPLTGQRSISLQLSATPLSLALHNLIKHFFILI